MDKITAVQNLTNNVGDTFWAFVSDNLLILAGIFILLLGLYFFKRLTKEAIFWAGDIGSDNPYHDTDWISDTYHDGKI